MKIDLNPKLQFEKVDCTKPHLNFLYKCLEERDPETSISHKKMPSMGQHIQFVSSHPYWRWFIVVSEEKYIGHFYLTTKTNLSGRAIGIFVAKEFQGKGYGKLILEKILKMYPEERLLANINPANTRSINLFEKTGFKKIQYTYELRR